MDVDYMLSVMESGKKELTSEGYGDMLFRPILYDYRALHILLEGTDATGAQLCPKLVDYSSSTTAMRAQKSAPASFYGNQSELGGLGFKLLI